jgi:Fe-S cluster biogenesis protein NfuA/nitrite reductase/ring-hydroxylating ferredoxin subunit
MPQEVQKDHHRAARIEILVQEVAAFPDPNTRATAQELVQALLEMYGEGLARLLELTAQSEASGLALIDTFANDDLLNSLFLLHGLHPVDIETRIVRALDEVRPYLKSHGGNVELVRVENDVAYLRLEGSCHGCPSSTITLKLAIEEAIYKAAPDLERLEVEGVTNPPTRQGIPVTFVPPQRQNTSKRSTELNGGWRVVEGLLSPAAGGHPIPLQAVTLQGKSLLFCRIADTYYAYSNRCTGCNASLDDGRLEGTTLICSTCGRHYDICRAGRCLDAPNGFLEPVPLLVEEGKVKVALSTLAKDDQSEAVLSTRSR